MSHHWTCSRCGAVHEGLPLSWGFDEPAHWHWLSDEQRAEGHLDTDLCWYTDDDGVARFVRGTIELPIRGGEGPDEEHFVIGVWVSLSEANFDWLREHWTAGPEEQGDPWFGWLCNGIPIYHPDTISLKTNVYLRGADLRPLIEVQHGEHPLARDQHEGITLARARELGEQWLHLTADE